MDFIDKDIEAYALEFTSPESEVMKNLNRETHLKKLQPRMLSGHLQGSFLSMVSKMINPKYILEIGTYTGYSAIALSEGLKKDGKLITLEFNKEHENMAKSYFEKSEKGSQIEMIIGNAIDIIPTLDYKWDLVFIDADKTNYSNYYDLIIDTLPSNSWIIADNILWSGKVLSNESKLDPDTQALKDFSQKVKDDPKVENTLLPFRDGLMLIRKK